jgi:hypothetical protein
VQLTVIPQNPIPTVASLSPATVTAGGAAFTLTVTGTNFVNGASTVRVNGSNRTTSYVSSTQLNAQIPSSDIATSGSVTIDVITQGPGGGLSDPVSLTVSAPANPLPVLTSISPSSLQVDSPGQTVILTGSNFISSSVALVNGSPRPTTFTSSDPTHLSAQLSTSDFAVLGQLAIRVFNPEPGGGQSAVSNLTVFAPAPTLTVLSPTNVIAGNGSTAVTLTGTNFIDESIAQVNGSARTSVINSSTQMTVTLTANDTANGGPLSITVVNPPPSGGTTAALTFTVINPVPSISSISPTSIMAGSGAQNIAVVGAGFVPGSSVTINGQNRAVFGDSGHLNVALQASDVASGGAISITVVNSTPGGGTSGAAILTVNNPAPVLDPNTPLTPAIVLAGGSAQTITVLGTGFVPTSTVTINGQNRATFVDSSHLSVAIQAMDITVSGTIAIAVANPAPGGGVSATATLAINNPVPSVTSLSQPTATTGVTPFQLTVLGSNFVNGATVQLKGASHTPLSGSDSRNLIIQLTAADLNVAGVFAVTATNPAPGGGQSTQSVSFTVYDPPTVTNVSPNVATIGQIPPPALTVTGTNFIAGSLVMINGAAHTPTSASTTTQLFIQLSLDPDLNSSAGVYPVTVITPTPGGVSTPNANSNLMLNNPVPLMSPTTPLTPASALAGSGAQTITVQGSGFVPLSKITINGQNRASTFVDANHMKVSILANETATAGTITTTVVNGAPGGGTTSATFTVNNPTPTISALSPNSVTAGGPAFTLTVTGTNFVSGATVQVNGASRTTTFVSATQLTAAIPASDLAAAATLQITVVNPVPSAGPSAASTLTVNTANNPVPTLSSLSKTSVSAGSAGFTLTVTGTNFISGSVVRVNGASRTTTFVSSTQLNATIPSSDLAVGANLSITVFNPAPGGGTSSALVLKVNNPVPSISSVSPSNIFAGGADFTLTINGSGFVTGSVVNVGVGNSFGPRTTTFVNSTQLTVQITSNDISTSGTQISVSVTNPGPGGGTSGTISLNVQ